MNERTIYEDGPAVGGTAKEYKALMFSTPCRRCLPDECHGHPLPGAGEFVPTGTSRAPGDFCAGVASPHGGRVKGDAHYRALGDHQPIVVTQAWSSTWDPRVIYPVSEAVANVARHATRGQAVRDLRKAAKLLEWAALVLEDKRPDPRDHFGG